ncbi:hypothetical protein L2E82_06179 [Cichorium intybus]|uniref:Uncharacterized protein n=1 Tax=Cichorium intybus TaxID=13427 RepID=A0ACB9H9E0_CICIN|nr:hypothetical protein L2E82_06179 [Cichorium intybus]
MTGLLTGSVFLSQVTKTKSWLLEMLQSPPDVVSGAAKGLGGTAVDSHGRLFWLESRPTESGRLVIVKAGNEENEEAIDVTPKDFSVRTVAQEYGGGAFSISGDTLVFSNYKDQRLYKQSLDSKDSAPVPRENLAL